MILLSFDIGIKNLAFGLLSFQSKQFRKVISFGVLNLIPNDTQNRCGSPTCQNRAKRCIGRGDKKIILCGNKKCESYVIEEWRKLYPNSKAKIKSYKPKKATQFSLIQIAECMSRWVKTQSPVWTKEGLTEILIEHQPVFRNPVMKSVEMILVGVLVSHGWTSIHFVHASKKTSKQSSYTQRKKESIQMIEEVMETDNANRSMFSDEIRTIWNQSRKRDDLADTITQAIAWCGSRP